jgi:hypothetical protein
LVAEYFARYVDGYGAEKMNDLVGRRMSPLPEVTSALVTAGLPMESAERFAVVAVDAVRVWLWYHSPKNSDRAYEYDLLLGGDGDGTVHGIPAVEPVDIAATAASLHAQYGDEMYREVFEPVFGDLLDEVKNEEGG